MKILKILKKSEMYEGMIVASNQNNLHLYKIMKINDDFISYKAVFLKVNGIFEPYIRGTVYRTSKDSKHDWVETCDTIKLDPIRLRDWKLEQLGI